MENELDGLSRIDYGEGYYISRDGDVFSFKSGKKKKLKHLTTGHKGYAKVRLYNGSKKDYKDFFVHRLVASAFIENPENLPCVNHKDENPANNCVENLEWCTKAYNNTYGSVTKKISETMKKRFRENPEWHERVSRNLTGRVHSAETREKIAKANRKPVACFNNGILVGVYDSALTAERVTGVKRTNIKKVINGERKSAGGYQWEYLACGGEIASRK